MVFPIYPPPACPISISFEDFESTLYEIFLHYIYIYLYYVLKGHNMHYESKNFSCKENIYFDWKHSLHYTYHMKNLMSIPYIYIIQYICLCMSCCKAAVDVIECLLRDQTLPVSI